MRPFWNVQKLLSSWKWYFQVNILLKKRSRTLGIDWESLTFGCPFVFTALEEKLLTSMWLVAFCIGLHGCQMLCRWYWMNACLVLWEASTSSGQWGLNHCFQDLLSGKWSRMRAVLHLLNRNLLNFQRKVLKCLMRHWAEILLFSNRKGKPPSHGFTYLDNSFGCNILVTALQSTLCLLLKDAELLFYSRWVTRSSACPWHWGKTFCNLELRVAKLLPIPRQAEASMCQTPKRYFWQR